MPSREHILVLGATGVSGIAFTKHVQTLPEALRPKLTLYVRSLGKLAKDTTSDSTIRICEGGLDDEHALNEAMAGGVTAVVSFLGSYLSFKHLIFRTTTPRPITDALPGVFSAMRENGIKRVFVLSTPGAYPLKKELPLSWYWYIPTVILPSVIVPQGHAEMRGIAEVTAKQDDLDWTIYRVPNLNDGDENLEVVAGSINQDYKGTTELSRGSLAKWILKSIEDRAWIKEVPMVSNP